MIYSIVFVCSWEHISNRLVTHLHMQVRYLCPKDCPDLRVYHQEIKVTSGFRATRKQAAVGFCKQLL